MPREVESLEVEISRGLRDQRAPATPAAAGAGAAPARPDSGGDPLEVRVLQSPLDRPREAFCKPFESRDLDLFLKTWDRLILASSAVRPEEDDCRQVFDEYVGEALSSRLFERHELEAFFAACRRRAAGSPESQCRELLATRVGEVLLQALFPGKLGKTFDNCMRYRDRATALRIRIGFGEQGHYRPEVVGAPWELLRWPRTAAFLNCGTDVQIVRYLDAVKRVLPLAAPAPLKVLAVFCAPEDQHAIDLEAHKRSLQEATIRFRRVQLRFLMNATLPRLRKRLLKDPCHVLHFLGHGGFRQNSGEGILFFEDDDHSTRTVTGSELVTKLDGIDTLRLVVLTTCVGARMLRRRGHHPLTGTAPALIAAGLPAVIAMQFPISEAAAAAFSSTFYPKLAEGLPVDLALGEARGEMFSTAKDRPSFEWATPVLFLQSPDGRILHIEESGAPLPPKRIAIFNIRDIGRETVDVADLQIDLESYFDGHFIRRSEDWNGIVLELLAAQLDFAVADDSAYHFDFAAPASIAFAAGYLFQAKRGIRLLVTQRGISRTSTWDVADPAPSRAAAWRRIRVVTGSSSWMCWREPLRKFPWRRGSRDVAVAVSVTNDVLPALVKYLTREDLNPPAIGTLILAELRGGPSQEAVANGGHALRLAEELCNRIHSHTSGRDSGTLHVFTSAPNVIPFLIGRLSRKLGRIRLYEYDFEGPESYQPSITLPPQKDSNSRPESRNANGQELTDVAETEREPAL